MSADDEIFPASQEGGHSLVIEYFDEELCGTCQCGAPCGYIRPDQSTDVLAQAWEKHVMTEVAR